MDTTPQVSDRSKLRQRMKWYLAQAQEYDSGRPEAGTENGIVAAARCAEMAAKYRKWANDLSVLIDDHIEPHA